MVGARPAVERTVVEFRVLGTFEVAVDGRVVPLGTPRARAVLALLVVHADTVVGIDRLVDELWADRAPGNARAEVHSYVSRLRRALGAAGTGRIVTRSPGYLLRPGAGEVDLRRFDELVAAARSARRSGAGPECLARFREALRLWRGPALGGVPPTPALEAEAARLAECRLEVSEESFDAALAAGESGELVAELSALVAGHPYRERSRALLMTALHRSGRQAEALRVFREGRDLLVAELGVEPGAALVELHERILRGDPGPRPPVTRPPAVGTRRVPAPPNTLPGDIADFTGREDEITRLTATVERGNAARTVVIGALGGMAGIGKTVTAVHLAHRLADRYPGGQLFVDLHAHTTAAQQPMRPAQALDVLLRALGVPGRRIPDDTEARSALWRAEAGRRKLLVVLDNAVDAAQVRPLLPGAPGCLALVTSRRHLADLDGADTLSLDSLRPCDATELFARVVGDDRPERDPAATRAVLAMCGHLPLAVRIAGARLRARPSWSVAHLAERLRDQDRLLSELCVGDRSVATAFALSYQQLDAAHRHLFRLLGLVPGASFDARVAAVLAEVGPAEAEALLEDLVDVHLLQEPVPGRYRFHDLIGLHAAATAERDEPAASRDAAVDRVLDHYRRAAEQADQALDGGYRAEGATDHDPVSAMDWFDREYPNLVAAAERAARRGRHTHAWRIRWAMGNYLFSRAKAAEWVAGHRQALVSARHVGDRWAEAAVLAGLASACSNTGDNEEALEHAERAVELFHALGDRTWETRARVTLNLVHVRRGRAREALRVLPRPEDLGEVDRVARLKVYNNLGYTYYRLGRYDEALPVLEEARRLCHAAGLPHKEPMAMASMGVVLSRLGRHREAAECLRDAHLGFERSGDRARAAYVLGKLGVVACAEGSVTAAVDRQDRALALLREADLPDVECEALNDLADTLWAHGTPDRARGCHVQASDVARRSGNLAEEARARVGLARADRDTDPAAARRHLLAALEIYDRIEAPEARQVRESLRAQGVVVEPEPSAAGVVAAT
ncbi:BTAD domain-containing putative transcriptional regulator [Saccharothrix sp. NPDC042600]|uniref:AfsR/SARP family transcriptional regulator n=1 Tax=Saccharothrix TaxID=2071 RepID=UPI0033EC186A